MAEWLWAGLNLKLWPDEAESYYHNLMGDAPALYVMTRGESGEWPEPFAVTASFDEAHAYLESEDDVHRVAMPPELYRRIEHFVLAHYVPQPRKKRKRQDWKGEARHGR